MNINVTININLTVQQSQQSQAKLAAEAERREKTNRALQELSLKVKKIYANKLLEQSPLAYLNYVRKHKLNME